MASLAIDANIVCAKRNTLHFLSGAESLACCNCFLKNTLPSHLSTTEGLQIKADGFNTFIPAKEALQLGRSVPYEGAVLGAGFMHETAFTHYSFNSRFFFSEKCFSGCSSHWLPLEPSTLCSTGKSTSLGRLKAKSSCSARLPSGNSSYTYTFFMIIFRSSGRVGANTITLFVIV